jgi:hypothetical protein
MAINLRIGGEGLNVGDGDERNYVYKITLFMFSAGLIYVAFYIRNQSSSALAKIIRSNCIKDLQSGKVRCISQIEYKVEGKTYKVDIETVGRAYFKDDIIEVEFKKNTPNIAEQCCFHSKIPIVILIIAGVLVVSTLAM